MSREPVPPPAWPWRVSAGRVDDRPLLVCDCDTPGQAAALVAVLARFWPGLQVGCQAPIPVPTRAA